MACNYVGENEDGGPRFRKKCTQSVNTKFKNVGAATHKTKQKKLKIFWNSKILF